MNRFRTKKKTRDDDGVPRPSQESESSMPFRGFRKAKKSQDNEKKEVDLATALPSNDDFRTSLLMTGLSARFSMLREQDDPNTKIGKASDDSVLYPKRQSRIDLASFRGLGDIAEVGSVKAASPFGRMDSYNSDDTDSLKSGSIMSRAKPTEGNNLFGGRQKIYKIPVNGGSSRTDGGMGGRALYDDDVAQSAFQRWRRAKKELDLSQDEADDSDAHDDQRNSSTDLEPPRSESPAFSSYDRKRETSSTLSSIPSVARHSSAGTSITSSQPAPSLKDWQPPSGYSSGPERSVTRTRRLYETGFFTQEGQESSTGGLSRMDTMNRQRPFGARTPDLGQQPSLLGLGDRLSGERKLMAKASAPDLRSTSPPASASSTGTPNLGIQIPSAGEGKSNFGGAPPLSPPISETDENSILPINPNDRGKATALGVFRKPVQPYDESRYAQRQLQLQRGRETPTQKGREEPNVPASENEPGSLSPVQKEGADSPTVPTSGTAQNASEASTVSNKPLPSPQIHLRRPSDREHPAFRGSALPMPSSLATGSESELPRVAEVSSSLLVESKDMSPADSPTLGPVVGSSGLSGMVRQHLRADSTASSIYEGVPPTAGLESRFPAASANSRIQQEYEAGSNPWGGDDHGRDWNLDLDVNEPLGDTESFVSSSSRLAESNMDQSLPSNGNTDEFASQLADGARRIREKLTSYVETDSRSSSPHRLGEQNAEFDTAPLPRPGGLGAILRPKSSKGSLTDRGRDPSSTRAFKMMGINPGGSRTASPGGESQKGHGEVDMEFEAHRGEKETVYGGEDQHIGLRQSRQPRQELHQLKEYESRSRYCPAPQGPPPDIPSPRQRNAKSPGGPRTRTPSRDQASSSVYYQQRAPGEEPWNVDSPPTPQASMRNDRHRSESESSYGTRSNNRADRPRDQSTNLENMHLSPPRSAQRSMMRSPGLPGTDIKRSHIMPPHPHPNAASRINQPNSGSNSKLYLPSPISPGISPLASSAPPTPATSSPPRPPFGQTLSYDNSAGFSSGAEGDRSRGNGRSAPPLPPINPRRRQDSANNGRTVAESFARPGRDNMGRDISASASNPLGESIYSGDRRGPAQRPVTGAAGTQMDFSQSRSSNTLNLGPPASRIVVTQGRNKQGNAGLPGGMI